MHAVLILRGRGYCLVGNEVRPIETRDLITVPAMAWHQFRATEGEPLGLLCMVNAKRDKPQLPTEMDLAGLKADPRMAAFLQAQAEAPRARRRSPIRNARLPQSGRGPGEKERPR